MWPYSAFADKPYQLKFRPVYVKGELLSSWMIRVAHFYGASPIKFWHYILQSHTVWNRDIDTHISESLRQKLRETIGYTNRALEILPSDKHWVLPVGIYHRRRFAYGLQYCPLCLSKKMIWPKLWRLGFFTVCPDHQSLLFDRCPQCSKPVEPHLDFKISLELWNCHQCGLSLTAAASTPDHPTYTQQCLSNCSDTYKINDQVISYNDFSLGVRLISQIIYRKNKFLEPSHLRSLCSSSPETRQSILLTVDDFLKDWPISFSMFLREHQIYPCELTQLRKLVPTWIYEPFKLPKKTFKGAPLHVKAPTPKKSIHEHDSRLVIDRVLGMMWFQVLDKTSNRKSQFQRYRNFQFAFSTYVLGWTIKRISSLHIIEGSYKNIRIGYQIKGITHELKVVNNPLWWVSVREYINIFKQELLTENKGQILYLFPPVNNNTNCTWVYKVLRKTINMCSSDNHNMLANFGLAHSQSQFDHIKSPLAFALNTNKEFQFSSSRRCTSL
ncbi:TniQ family protein [Vibrio sp. THAF64]|uniref:TniQ family protein n=1 Tax=unclassified Vibrio TaxID=2614977 RepID=UPI0012687AF2|nr:hypothetical protein FIU99_00170 [Vibrio sp. THAF64]QGM32755.1 hypothetical protein GGC04_00170 [Vibrio sp. THAF191d]